MKKMKKYIKKHNDLFAITGMIILILISCIIIVGVITVANYNYFIKHDDIELNITVPEKLKNGIDTQGLAKHPSPAQSLDKPISADTLPTDFAPEKEITRWKNII